MTHVPFDPSRSLLVIKATIYGHGRARTIDLALDLGASTTTIATAIVVGLDYDPAESTRRVRIIMASGLEYCSVVTVARIEAIGQSVDDIDVICHDLPEESHIGGLPGLNFLRHFELTSRYSDGTLCLERIPQESDPTPGRARGAL
jgi:predicted aspartyl protease